MKGKITLCALVASAIIGMSGCGSGPATLTTIYGQPLSVAQANSFAEHYFSAVFNVDGKTVLAYNNHGVVDKHTYATALLYSEMNDGDDELVELRGKYEDDIFKIFSLKANGYEIDFSKR